MMRRAIYLLLVLCAIFCTRMLHAQDWQPVLKLNGTFGSCAFFRNEQTGWIGTGSYLSAIPAQIYWTTDGGSTWQRAQFTNPNILGQITDIYFRSADEGWATLCEYRETGWSGVYHTT
ncbi:MAG TPA: hypothetical protein VGM92_14270, partial [Candidatus Kapabacteria bacterium]